MFNVKYISNCLNENIDDIKIAALYYDKIEIMNNNVYTLSKPKVEFVDGKKSTFSLIRGAYECISKEFIEDLKLLESEGLVTYFDSIDYTIEPADDDSIDSDPPSELMKEAMKQAGYLLHDMDNKLWYGKSTTDGMHIKFNSEVEKVHEEYINKLKVGAVVDFEFLYVYYRNLLSYLLYNIFSSENTLTSSTLLDEYLRCFYLNGLMGKAKHEDLIKKSGTPNIVMEAIKLSIPDVSQMPLEDILELRYRLSDELISFRNHSMKLNKEIRENFVQKDIVLNTKQCVEVTLKPALDDLTRKIKGAKLNIASKFISEIKDPKSYAPLLGNIFMNIPAHLTFLLSIGLIGAKTGLECYKDFNEINQNGLYYLIKLRNASKY